MASTECSPEVEKRLLVQLCEISMVVSIEYNHVLSVHMFLGNVCFVSGYLRMSARSFFDKFAPTLQ